MIRRRPYPTRRTRTTRHNNKTNAHTHAHKNIRHTRVRIEPKQTRNKRHTQVEENEQRNRTQKKQSRRQHSDDNAASFTECAKVRRVQIGCRSPIFSFLSLLFFSFLFPLPCVCFGTLTQKSHTHALRFLRTLPQKPCRHRDGRTRARTHTDQKRRPPDEKNDLCNGRLRLGWNDEIKKQHKLQTAKTVRLTKNTFFLVTKKTKKRVPSCRRARALHPLRLSLLCLSKPETPSISPFLLSFPPSSRVVAGDVSLFR